MCAPTVQEGTRNSTNSPVVSVGSLPGSADLEQGGMVAERVGWAGGVVGLLKDDVRRLFHSRSAPEVGEILCKPFH